MLATAAAAAHPTKKAGGFSILPILLLVWCGCMCVGYVDPDEYDRMRKRAVAGAQASLLGVRPIETVSQNHWREHLPRLKFQLDQYSELAATITRYGYETNDDWLAELQNISPLAQGYGEKPRAALAGIESRFRYWLKTRRYLRRTRS